MFSVVVHLVELVSNHMLRWIGLKLVTMWIAQKCISVNARIHIQSGLKLVRNCSVNRPLVIKPTGSSTSSLPIVECVGVSRDSNHTQPCSTRKEKPIPSSSAFRIYR